MPPEKVHSDQQVEPNWTHPEIVAAVQAALAEDIGAGDVTSIATVPVDRRAQATFFTREEMVVAGVEILPLFFDDLTLHVASGHFAGPGTPLATVRGLARTLLSRERTSLNFLQRLCGIATVARSFADAVAGTGCRVLDTRKTTPGLRRLEKTRRGCRRHHQPPPRPVRRDSDQEQSHRRRGRRPCRATSRAATIAAHRDRSPNPRRTRRSPRLRRHPPSARQPDARRGAAMDSTDRRPRYGRTLRRHHPRHRPRLCGNRRRLRLVRSHHPFGSRRSTSISVSAFFDQCLLTSLRSSASAGASHRVASTPSTPPCTGPHTSPAMAPLRFHRRRRTANRRTRPPRPLLALAYANDGLYCTFILGSTLRHSNSPSSLSRLASPSPTPCACSAASMPTFAGPMTFSSTIARSRASSHNSRTAPSSPASGSTSTNPLSPDLAAIATSLLLETGREHKREPLLLYLAGSIDSYVHILTTRWHRSHPAPLHARSTYASGRRSPSMRRTVRFTAPRPASPPTASCASTRTMAQWLQFMLAV